MAGVEPLTHLRAAESLLTAGAYQSAIAHALIAIAERLPAPKPLDVDAYSGHNTYTNEQM